MKDLGVPNHLIWLVSKLYEGAKGVVRTNAGHTESFEFQKGVKQGCLISPLLFNVVGEMIMRTVDSKCPEDHGIVIG